MGLGIEIMDGTMTRYTVIVCQNAEWMGTELVQLGQRLQQHHTLGHEIWDGALQTLINQHMNVREGLLGAEMVIRVNGVLPEDRTPGLYSLWTVAVGNDRHPGTPICHGQSMDFTFRDACRKFAETHPEWATDYDPEQNTYQGLPLYTTALDAQQGMLGLQSRE